MPTLSPFWYNESVPLPRSSSMPMFQFPRRNRRLLPRWIPAGFPPNLKSNTLRLSRNDKDARSPPILMSFLVTDHPGRSNWTGQTRSIASDPNPEPRRLLRRGQSVEGGLVPGSERSARGPDPAKLAGPQERGEVAEDVDAGQGGPDLARPFESPRPEDHGTGPRTAREGVRKACFHRKFDSILRQKLPLVALAAAEAEAGARLKINGAPAGGGGREVAKKNTPNTDVLQWRRHPPPAVAGARNTAGGEGGVRGPRRLSGAEDVRPSGPAKHGPAPAPAPRSWSRLPRWEGLAEAM
ncbi:hypothetical protein THAOC_28160, partial [Thalassiosira oceanica]